MSDAPEAPTINDLTEGRPCINRFSIGECEMLNRPSGNWMKINELHAVLDWIVNDDDRDTMLAKIALIREELT